MCVCVCVRVFQLEVYELGTIILLFHVKLRQRCFWENLLNSKCLKERKWLVATHTLNFCSAFNPSKYTHKAVRSEHTHTHREHTPGAVGSQCCGARGAVGGSVPCSMVSPQSWYWRRRERWLFTPPTYNPCRTWDSNPQLLGYKSNSLSIRPRLPLLFCSFFFLRKGNTFKCYTQPNSLPQCYSAV